MTTVPAWNRIKTRLEELGYSLTLEQFKNLEVTVRIIETGRCTYTIESQITGDLDTLVDIDDVLDYDTDEYDLQDRLSEQLRESGEIYEGNVLSSEYEDHDVDECYVNEVAYQVTMEDGEVVDLNKSDITELIQTMGRE